MEGTVKKTNPISIIAYVDIEAPLKKKLSKKDIQKIRKIYKNALLNDWKVGAPSKLELLEELFGRALFKDIIELDKNQKLFSNTKI